MMEQVNHVLAQRAAALGVPAAELASTLCVALLFRRRGTRLLLGLGDSAIYTFGPGGVRLAVAPRRLGGSSTPLTTTRGAYRSAEVRVERPAAPEGVLLCSDGVAAALGTAALTGCLRQAGPAPRLQALLEQAACPDDCGFLCRTP